MSKDGIALHQLAFDGHWHELARVALTNAALRERLSNMRSVAAKLEGRKFTVSIWLPEEQILQKELSLKGSDDGARLTEAKAEIARIIGGKPADYAVQLGAVNESGAHAVAAVRIKTLQEASTFAKSHGFRARSYSTLAAVAGFATPPAFRLPADRVKAVVLGVVATSAAALVLGGGFAFYTIDPLNMWETPPRAADFAPFQQPNPTIERAGLPAVSKALGNLPVLPVFASISADATRYPLPYLPPRQLTADALETVQAPVAPDQDSPPQALALPSTVAVNWPATLAPLAAASSPDFTPSLGLFNLLDHVADLPLPVTDALPPSSGSAPARFTAPARPLTVANTAFYLEPLPAMATRLSPDALAEFVSRSGLTVEQLSGMASPLLLIESKVIEVTPGLPPILPRLRSGQAIPPQVAPPVQVTPETPPVIAPVETGPAPLFAVVNGRPDIRPAFRLAPVEVQPPAEILPFAIVNGAPDLRPPQRLVEEAAPVPETVEPAETVTPDPEADTPAPEAPTPETGVNPVAEQPATATVPRDTPEVASESDVISAAIDSAVNAMALETPAPLQNDTPELFALVSGQPALLPRLRSGAEVPPLDTPIIAGPAVSPATAEANALRPRRRPQAIVELPAPIESTISGAAPATATRPGHRNAAFAANAARIIEQNANRPRVSAPVVPADPQTVSLPSSASVARAATIENAINLRQTNLIGIFGTADARTALIMLSGGRLVRVQLGQSFSGWTVVAITENTVRIRKRNREEILRMPAE